jgi:hypothetical protein
VLERGYALVLDAEGGVVRSTNQLRAATRSPRASPTAPFISRVESQAKKRTKK